MNRKTWDETFMEVARVFSLRSEDESTKVGAIIVDKDNNIRAMGYNGLPRKVKDKETRHQKPVKYDYFVHAEINVIAAAARSGISTNGCKLYVTLCPCSGCARAIIQAGISEVIVGTALVPKRWSESATIAIRMFKEAGISIKALKEK